MYKLILGFLVLFFGINTCFSQPIIKYDTSLVSNDTELNFYRTIKRGIQSGDIVYMVEKNLQIVTAYNRGKVKWKANIIEACGEPSVGSPHIRFIRLDLYRIFLVFGKHDYAQINLTDGKIEYLGAD